jgi:hypothetical protein
MTVICNGEILLNVRSFQCPYANAYQWFTLFPHQNYTKFVNSDLNKIVKAIKDASGEYKKNEKQILITSTWKSQCYSVSIQTITAKSYSLKLLGCLRVKPYCGKVN